MNDPQAFPVQELKEGFNGVLPAEYHSGMDLLTYIATEAMQSLSLEHYNPKISREDWIAKIAEVSYDIAEAMLKEREKRMK